MIPCQVSDNIMQFLQRIFLFLHFSTLSLIAADKPWPGVEYTEVRAYAWPKEARTPLVKKDDMSLQPGMLNPQGALLTADQVKRLLAAVTGKHPEYDGFRCYLPHNALIFYNAKKEPVAFIEICFDCLRHHSFPAGAATNFDMAALATLFHEHRLPFGEESSLEAFKKHFQSSLKR